MSDRNINAAIIGFYMLRFGVAGEPVNDDGDVKVRSSGRPVFDEDGNFVGASQ